MPTPQEIAQTLLVAVTATLNADEHSAAAARRELIDDFDPNDVVETAVGLITTLVLMCGPQDQAGVLRELAKWVAER